MGYDAKDLSQLLASSQKGNRSDYQSFLTGIWPLIDSRVRKRVFNRDDVSDVTQEALLSIHKALATYDTKRSVLPWVIAITERRVVDYIRRTTRKNEMETLTADGDVTFYEAQTKLPTGAHEILALLPEESRRAIELTKVEGYSTKEAAKILGIKENAVRTRISRAMSQLKEKMKAKERE